MVTLDGQSCVYSILFTLGVILHGVTQRRQFPGGVLRSRSGSFGGLHSVLLTKFSSANLVVVIAFLESNDQATLHRSSLHIHLFTDLLTT
jgi:hypothetical protein